MSGVVALFDRGGGGVDRDRLAAMLDSIAHRGPDGRGSWCDGRVGIGHQQLVSTPEARADDQPRRDGDLVLAADARIDNRDELFEALALSDPSIPDSRLLLAAYREWGEQCVDRLVGAFAFVVWDAGEGTLFCARDHMGVKPLYYYRDERTFAAASEVKALLALPAVPRTLDETKIGDFLVGRFGDRENTYYEAISRLPPAHATTVGRAGTRTWQYWDLDPDRTIRLDSDAAYERRFRELFAEAVRCRLRSADPVGATLSGGLDSSSVTVMARDVLPPDEPLHTFSWVFDETPASDEREYVEAVTDRDGIDSHYLSLDDVGVLVDGDDVFAHFDEPPFNSMHYAWWETTKRAADVGAGVLLTGALGDSAASYGLGLLPDLFRRGRWLRLSEELRALSDRRGIPPRKLFFELVCKPLVPEPIKRYNRAYRGQQILEARRNPLVNRTFAERIGLRSRYRRLYRTGSLLGPSAREQQYRSITMGLTTENLETIDLRCARFGVEPRHPFADKRLLEFSLAMPADQQLSDGLTRSVVRRSLSDLLPDPIRSRIGKTSVSEAFWRALSLERERLEELLANPGPIAEYYDVAALRDAYDRFERDRRPDSHEARALWKALSLSAWLNAREGPSTGKRDRI